MSIYEHIQGNKIKTVFIMVFFTLFTTMLAYLLGKSLGYGTSWVGIALVFTGVTSIASYYYSDKIVLSISLKVLLQSNPCLRVFSLHLMHS